MNEIYRGKTESYIDFKTALNREIVEEVGTEANIEIEEFTGYAESDYKHNEPSMRFLKKLRLI